MQFAALTNAWFAFVIPLIVLLYLFKRNYANTPISSHMLWHRALKDMEAVRPWQKLRSRLLLFIQLLIAALLVFALMKPLFPFAKQTEAHVIFVVDRSASMQALLLNEEQTYADGGGMRRYDQALNEVERWMKERQADAYSVVLTGNPPEIALQHQSDASAVMQAMKGIEPHYGDVRYGESLALAAALAANDDESTIVLVSDGIWSDISAEHVEPLNDTQIEWLPIVDEQAVNVSIARFGASRVGAGEEEEAIATALIHNASRQSIDVDLSLYGDDRLIERSTVTVEAVGDKAIYFQHLPIASTYRLQIDTPDALKEDNVSYAFLESREKKTILFVGEPSYFVQQVLAVMDADTVYARLGEDGHYVIPQDDLFPIDLIVVEQVDEGMIDTEQWRRLFDQKPVWLLEPLRAAKDVEEVLLEQQKSRSVEVIEHPLTRYVRWAQPFVTKAYVPEQTPWPHMEPIVFIDDVPLVYAGIYQGVPKLMHTFSLSDSDFPLRAEFPIWTNQAIAWLSDTQKDHLNASLAGSYRSVAFALDTEFYRWERLEDEGNTVEYTSWNPVMTNDIQMPFVPGLYALVERNSSGLMTNQRKVFVYMNEEESEMHKQPLWETWPQQGNGLPEYDEHRTTRTAYSDFLPLWVGMIILLLLIEWEVYQRGHSF